MSHGYDNRAVKKMQTDFARASDDLDYPIIFIAATQERRVSRAGKEI